MPVPSRMSAHPRRAPPRLVQIRVRGTVERLRHTIRQLDEHQGLRTSPPDAHGAGILPRRPQRRLVLKGGGKQGQVVPLFSYDDPIAVLGLHDYSSSDMPAVLAQVGVGMTGQPYELFTFEGSAIVPARMTFPSAGLTGLAGGGAAEHWPRSVLRQPGRRTPCHPGVLVRPLGLQLQPSRTQMAASPLPRGTA